MDVDHSSGEIKNENSCIVLESDDDDDDDCAVVMKSEDDDLIFVGMSPATISGDEDEDGTKGSGKQSSDDEDIVFISRSCPQVEALKTESGSGSGESESEPSGYTGFDPFGKDSTDACTGSWLDQAADTSPLSTDKPCGWVTSGDLSTPTLPDLPASNTDTLNTPTVDLNTPSDLNTPMTTSATDEVTSTSADCTTTTQSGANDSSGSDDTKMDVSPPCVPSTTNWSSDKLCSSNLDDPCQRASVMLSSKDPMISGKSSDTVDTSAISSLLHQLKSLAECSSASVTCPNPPTNVTTSVRNFSSTHTTCQANKNCNSGGDLPSGRGCHCKLSFCKKFFKCSKSKKHHSDDLPRLLFKKKKKRCLDNNDNCSLTKDLSGIAASNNMSDDSDSDISTRVNCGSPDNSLSDFPVTPSSSSDSFKTSTSNGLVTTSPSPSCSYVVSSCSSKSADSGLKMRLRLLGSQKQDKVPLMPPKARYKLTRTIFNNESDACSSCGEKNSEKSFSTCLQGHFTCKGCLEKSAKELLTNSKKGSLRCTYANCDSLFSRDALRQTLPTILVEILEERLDKEAVDMVLQANKHPQAGSATNNRQTSQSSQMDDSSSSSDESGKLTQEENKNKGRVDNSITSSFSHPARWQPMDPNPKDGYILVPLEGGCEEYLDLAIQFHNTMFFPRADIKRIYRVQNPILWQFFCVKKSQMQQQMRQEQNRDNVDERRHLFHGTSSDAAHPICKSGFDWRLCGVHGTAYGQGSYFARDASYSHMYTEQRNGPVASKDLLSSLMRRGFRNGMSIQSVQAHLSTATTNSQRHSLARRLGALLALQAGSASISHYATYMPPLTTNNPPTSAHSSGQPMNLSTSQPLNLSVGLSPQVPVPSTTAPTATTSYHPSSGYQGSNLQCEHSDPNDPVRVMFAARVLVGQYAQGKSHYRKPPPLYHPYGRCFDSCVDNTSDPKIFVIFESSQCYPEYIIEYINKPRPGQPVAY